MDIDILLKALDNDSNEQIMKRTLKQIKELKTTMLKELELESKVFTEYLNKLTDYH